MIEDLNSDYRETNPASGRVEVLNPESPDYNTSASALNHSATCQNTFTKKWPDKRSIGILDVTWHLTSAPPPSWPKLSQRRRTWSSHVTLLFTKGGYKMDKDLQCGIKLSICPWNPLFGDEDCRCTLFLRLFPYNWFDGCKIQNKIKA